MIIIAAITALIVNLEPEPEHFEHRVVKHADDKYVVERYIKYPGWQFNQTYNNSADAIATAQAQNKLFLNAQPKPPIIYQK